MTSYQFTVLNLKELNLAPENVNTLGDLIQNIREEIADKKYLVDEIKEVLNLYDKIERINKFVLDENNFFNDNNDGILFDDEFFDSIREDKITRQFLEIKEKNIFDEEELEEKNKELNELWYNKSNNEMFEELTHDAVRDYIDFIKYAIDQILEDINEYFYEIYYNYEEVDYLNKPFEN